MKGKPKFSNSVNISDRWFKHVPTRDKEHLLRSLHSLVNRQAPTPSFKLYGKADWSSVTDFLSSKKVRATHPPKWLLEYEESRESKFGPQGGHAPWSELRENAEMYFTRPKESRIEPKPETLLKYRKLQLLMQSPEDALVTMRKDGKIMDRANGWRLFALKKTDERAQRDALYLIRSGEWKEGWAYFFSRFNKQKKRLFMPMPFCANIRQGQWANPFLKAIQEDLRKHKDTSDFSFWGDKIGFAPLFLEIMTNKVRPYGDKADHFVYVMRDFDKMDTSVGVSQKENSFVSKICESYHYPRDSERAKEVTEAMLFSNRCPIATPDGMWVGDHGEASGATVTNEGETCCNEDYDEYMHSIIMSECDKAGIRVTRLVSVGNGDDGMSIYLLDDLTRFEEFKSIITQAATQAAEAGGYVIQADKWEINLGTYGKYCQYLTTWDASLNRMRMYYPAALILNSIENPEKQYQPADWDKDFRDNDIIMKLSTGWDLEYFHDLIDFVDHGMKYRLLGRTESETRRILSKWDKYWAQRLGSADYNVVDEEWIRDPLTNPVVRYLLTKRNYNISSISR